jgi:ribosome maturation factor RimP
MNRSPAQSLEVTLEQLLQPALEEKGVELVELSISGNTRRYVLRLFVDRPAGISIGECAQLSRDLADLLDTHDPIRASYTLEVSSPGLTRPLKTKRDFERALGKVVRLIARSGHDHLGKLTTVEDTAITLDVDGESLSIALEDITKANLHFEI